MSVANEDPTRKMGELSPAATELASPSEITLLSNQDLARFLIMAGGARDRCQLLVRLSGVSRCVFGQQRQPFAVGRTTWHGRAMQAV